MSAYIVRRIFQSIVILFGLSILFFAILHLTPGGPCSAYEPGGGVAALVRMKTCNARLHLNDPIVTQYVDWISNYLHGDLGTTIGGNSVAAEILQKLPATILLATVSYFFQQLLALPLGMFSALRQYSFFDQLFTFGSYAGLSMPTFWLGLILIYVFAVHWTLLPAGRVEDVTIPIFWSHAWFQGLVHNPGLILGNLAQHLVLPAFTLMFVGIAVDSRFMRASMLEVLNQDYIRTATAKGLTRRVVIFKHAFRNAVLPIITNIALYLPALVGGFIITETVFSWDGIGYTFITSITTDDYGVVLAILMMTSLAVLVANLLADLTYAWVDPRIRYD